MKNKGNPTINAKHKSVMGRMAFIMVLGIFLLLCVTLLVTFGFMALIRQWWDMSEDNIFVFGLVVLAISIVVGFCLSFAYSAIMVNASKPYLDALQKIAEGDFSARIKDSPIFVNFKIADRFNDMAEELQNLEMLKESFISDFSHEFKTPIVSIAGFAKLLKSSNLTQEQRDEYLDVIIDESSRLVDLSENFLLLNRLNTQTVEKEEYDLDEQIRQCVLLFEKQLEQRNISVDLDLQEVTVYSGKKLISQLVVNLLSNAIKFSNDGGVVEVRCKAQGSGVVIDVVDHGCGMTNEVKKNIFTKFYQGDQSRTTVGNGLGLSIVKKVVELLDGEIEVTSQLGVGSAFSVTLPNTFVK